MKNPTTYLRPNIRRLSPYSTARDEFKGGDIDIWVDANENPYENGLNRYPDPHQKQLKTAIAKLKHVQEDMIFVGGAGSDEAIDLCFRLFCNPGRDNVVAVSPSYGVYKVSAEINDIEYREVLLSEDFSLPAGRLLKACDRNTKIIWICSPNNPTGNAFPPEEILSVADNFDGMVVVDEAYGDFSPYPSLIDQITTHPNVIVLQTFSKAWGLASMRVGMAFAVADIAAVFGKVKYPYNLNGPTQAKLLDILDNSTPPTDAIAEILSQKKLIVEQLKVLPHVVKVYPSDANFVLVKFKNADAVYDYLIANGVIARNRSNQKMCANTLRITVGTPDENRRLIELLKNYTPDE